VASLDHPVDEESNADDCQHDKAKRELQDRSFVAEQARFRNSPAVEEEEWGRNSRKKISGFERDAEIGHRLRWQSRANLNERWR